MKLLAGLSALGLVLAAGGIAHAADVDPEQAQLMCDLTGDCADLQGPDAATGGVSAPAASKPGRGTPRSSQTRGFSFQRATDPKVQTATATTTRPVAAPAARPIVKPAQVGSADLRLTFVSGSAILTDGAKERLAKYASVLTGPKLGMRRLRIEGHTDAVGSARANQDLSRRRAQAVADFLNAAGVEQKRLEVVGYGSSKPLPGVAPQAAENRRVMAVLL